MKKIILLISVFVFFTFNAYGNTGDIVIPEDISWTDRFILTELKELRIGLEGTKREIYSEIQNREIEAVDKALSYSANTVNFLFVFITLIIMGFGVVGWRTIGDIKQSTKENMDRETKKIISDFQKKIQELEKEQKVNILWRQFSLSESDVDKLDVLDRIYKIKPESVAVLEEKGNVYLSMGLYEQVVEISSQVLLLNLKQNQSHALYNRICAYSNLGEIDKTIIDINHLLQISPEYKDIMTESPYLSLVLGNMKIKKLLQL